MSSEAADPRRWIALILLTATQFMLIIDVSIVNVALPTIEIDLHFNNSSLQWVASAYALTFGGFLLLGGRMADLLGRRRLFMAGLALFTLASLACGFATSNNFLIGARAVQGLGGAMIAPAALSILTTTFAEGEERNKALAVWGAVSGAGGAVGVLLGGVLTQYVGWEWVFFVNAPIGLAAILLAPRLLKESRVEDAVRSFDVIGAILVTASLSLLVYTVVKTDQYHWFSGRTLGFFAVSVVLMARSCSTSSAPPHPLLPLSIFRLPTIVGRERRRLHARRGDLRDVLPARALHAAARRASTTPPIRSGIGYLLIACTIIVSAGASQVLVGKLGRAQRAADRPRAADARTALLHARRLRTAPTSAISRRASCSAGIGLGFAFIPVTIAALQGISNDQAGLASGLINTSQQIGGAVGVALLATVFASRTADQSTAGVCARDGLHRRALARVPGRRADDGDRHRGDARVRRNVKVERAVRAAEAAASGGAYAADCRGAPGSAEGGSGRGTTAAAASSSRCAKRKAGAETLTAATTRPALSRTGAAAATRPARTPRARSRSRARAPLRSARPRRPARVRPARRARGRMRGPGRRRGGASGGRGLPTTAGAWIALAGDSESSVSTLAPWRTERCALSPSWCTSSRSRRGAAASSRGSPARAASAKTCQPMR